MTQEDQQNHPAEPSPNCRPAESLTDKTYCLNPLSFGVVCNTAIDNWHKWFFFFFYFFWPRHAARGILVSRPGIELMPPAVEVWCLNHWTAREVPNGLFVCFFNKCKKFRNKKKAQRHNLTSNVNYH